MPKLRIYTAFIILVCISFLFSYKYAGEVTAYPFYVAMSISIIQLIFFYFRTAIKRLPISKWLPFLGIIFTGLLVLLSNIYIDVHTLSIDRWSVITSFLDATFEGTYPYFAQSHGGNFPGPMPVYYLIALPFYLIGELSLLSALGYIIAFFWLINKCKWSHAYLVLYLLSSVYMEWEIVTRSNIFTYSILSLVALEFYAKTEKNQIKGRFVISAMLIGLLLSTRSVVALPYIVYFLSDLFYKRISFKNLSLFSLIAIMFFALTFVPIYINFPKSFWVMNPFIIQSGFLIPAMYIPLFFIIAIGLAVLSKNGKEQSYYAGISLFVAISIYAVYHIIINGLQEALLYDAIDISYFILCVPFLLFYLLNDTRFSKSQKGASSIALRNY